MCRNKSPCFQGILLIRTYVSSLQLVLCCVAAVHHHSEDYIFRSFGIIEFIFYSFENKAPLKPVLGDVAGVVHFITDHEQGVVLASKASY